MAVLVTGVAGFVGYHVAAALLARGEQVVGVDNLNDYYDVRLKEARLALLAKEARFGFTRLDIADGGALKDCSAVRQAGITDIVHLAAQAGVRHSMVDPHAYVRSNVVGHLNVLEFARTLPGLRHLVYASSSSVYGANRDLPFAEVDRVDRPLSMYAATKRADELMSYAYGHLYGIPQTGLRFFTVYGPWGRPDMAYFMFAEAIMRGEPITVYDDGSLRRDFTYIDDIVAGVVGCLDHPPQGGGSEPPLRILNIGNHRSEAVSTLIELLEDGLGKPAIRRFVPRPLADVTETWASVDQLHDLTGYSPTTPLSVGVARFVSWFCNWHSHHG
jgi:UDP-glucuronate 4-epimerase